MPEPTARPAASGPPPPRIFQPSSDVLAIRPEALDRLRRHAAAAANGGPEAVDFSWFMSGPRPNERTDRGVSIVHVIGPLQHHMTPWGCDSYEEIYSRLSDAASGADVVREARMRAYWDASVVIPQQTPPKAIAMLFDSPGGEAAGASQLHRRILDLRASTGIPIYGFANEEACSAGYELISACEEVWGSDCATIGSIGVIATLFDRTVQNAMIGFGIELITSGKYKADGHPDRPITNGVRGRTQVRVDDLARIFFELVASARDTTPEAISDLEAGVFIGQDAVTAGIADGVCDLTQFLDMVSDAADGDATEPSGE